MYDYFRFKFIKTFTNSISFIAVISSTFMYIKYGFSNVNVCTLLLGVHNNSVVNITADSNYGFFAKNTLIEDFSIERNPT